jgi:ribosomal protein L29
MKTKELRGLSKEEQDKKLDELHKELMQDRSQMSAGTPPKSTGLMRERKKTIARIHTIRNE